MNIEWLRDLLICIFAGVGTIVSIIITVLCLKCYLRAGAILNSAKAISNNIRDVTSLFRNEILKPILQLIAIIQGVRKGVETVSSFCKKEGRKDG